MNEKELAQRLARYSLERKAVLALLCVTFDLKPTPAALDRIDKLKGARDHEILAALKG